MLTKLISIRLYALTLPVAMVALLMTPTVGQTQRPDFSGKWTLDMGKSQGLPWLNLKEYSMIVAYNRQTEQLSVKTRIHEESFAFTPQAGVEYKFRPTPLLEAVYSLDGTEVTVQDPVSVTPLEVKQTATWRGDQLQLQNRFENTRDGKKYKWTTIDVWQMSADGQYLTVDQSLERANRTQHEIFVFRKL
jgi:hypothetical protein